jgi:CRISPR-associated protein Cmr4
MFSTGKLLFLYCESLVHPGAGSGTGAIDLPIQRERVTNWPIIQSSGLKGSMRDHYEAECSDVDKLFTVFGPDPLKTDSNGNRGNPADNSGAISFSDASVLLFPVRSLKGTFAYLTCPLALARLRRSLQAVPNLGTALPVEVQNISASDRTQIFLPELVADGDNTTDSLLVITGGKVVIEESVFTVQRSAGVGKLAEWLGNLWTNGGRQAVDAPWLELARRIAVVSDEVFKDFVEFSTEVLTRNKIDDDKGTVIEGALWTEECLPRETLLYSVFLACKPRRALASFSDAGKVAEFISQTHAPKRIWYGGDITTGRGLLRTFFA